MSSPAQVVITRDTFLGQLGLMDLSSRIRDRREGDEVYKAVLGFLQAENAVELREASGGQVRELNLMIPGTPLHVRLTSELKEKLNGLMIIALILLGIGQGAWPTVGTAVLAGLVAKITKLRKEYGELCIVESLGEVAKRSDESVCTNLYGRPCRYPNAACQFMKSEGQTCLFGLAEIKQTLTALEARDVLRRENSVEPFIWKVRL
ncbi:MAG TPA: hypothetical protein VGC93_02140 [Thermoanaerobaculia bacterium]